jgi:hypothetical protein
METTITTSSQSEEETAGVSDWQQYAQDLGAAQQ